MKHIGGFRDEHKLRIRIKYKERDCGSYIIMVVNGSPGIQHGVFATGIHYGFFSRCIFHMEHIMTKQLAEMTRGDSYKGLISITAAEAITITLVTFTLRHSEKGEIKATHNTDSEAAMFTITGNGTTTPTILFSLAPADTRGLEAGTYPADVEVVLSTGETKTLLIDFLIHADMTR
jgi:hypothetical protein